MSPVTRCHKALHRKSRGARARSTSLESKARGSSAKRESRARSMSLERKVRAPGEAGYLASPYVSHMAKYRILSAKIQQNRSTFCCFFALHVVIVVFRIYTRCYNLWRKFTANCSNSRSDVKKSGMSLNCLEINSHYFNQI